MSWSKLGLALLLMSGLGALAGCGYSPLYGESSAGVQASDAMQRISIAAIDKGLVGVDVQTALLDQMNPNGVPAEPLHRLVVRLTPSLGGLLVQPDAAITRYNYTLVGVYQLIDLKTGKVALQGDVLGTSAYNVVSNEYATVAARRDAERRAARTVSDGIVLRVALYLKNGPIVKDAPDPKDGLNPKAEPNPKDAPKPKVGPT